MPTEAPPRGAEASPNSTAIDWEELDGGTRLVGRRALAFVAGVAAVVVAFGYDRFVRASDLPPLRVWPAGVHEWLLALAFVAFACYVVWPLAADRDRTRRYWRRLRRNPAGTVAFGYIAVFVAAGTVGPALVGDPPANLLRQYQPPVFLTSYEGVTSPCVGEMVDKQCHGTWQYPLGTNSKGDGVVMIVVQGARIALLVALVAALFIAPLATAVGVLAGYYGGWVDEVLMRYVDVQEALPAFVVYIFAAAILGESLWLLLVAFGLLSWGGIARLVRSETLQRKEAGYVQAAREAGAGRLYVARRHLAPNVSSTALTATTQLVPTLILTEAAVSFLHLTDASLPSWGETLSHGLSGQYASFPPTFSPVGWNASMLPTFWEKWWTASFTTLALVATVVAFAVFGDALRDVFDPRSES